MNNRDYTRRVIARLAGDGKFELPQLTREEVLVLYEDAKIADELAFIERFYARMIAPEAMSSDNVTRQAYLLELKATVEAMYGDGSITLEEYEYLLAPRGTKPRPEAWANARPVEYLTPRDFGVAANGERVFTLQIGHQQHIFLTFEGNRWIKHDGYPYSVF